MKLSLFFLLICLSISAKALDCDKVDAINRNIQMRELAKWEMKGNRLEVQWTYPTEKLSKEKRLELIRTFAGVDACLTGEARYIRFYRNKKLIGVASPSFGIRLAE